MDQLARSRGVRDDRGQLMLVTAFALALLLVVLMLFLNAAVFAETAATRGGGASGGDDATRVRDAAVRATAGAVTSANLNHDTIADQKSALDSTLEIWAENANRHTAVQTADVDVTVTGHEKGARIGQSDASRTLTSATGDGTWALAEETDGTRGFRLNLTRSSLVVATDGDDAAALESAGVFHVVVSKGTETWRVFAYRDGANHVAIRVASTDGTLSSVCRTQTNGSAVVDLSGATLNGSACAPLSFFADVSEGGPHDIGFEAGDNATGTYVLVVHETADAVNDPDLNLNGVGGDPYVTPALYSVSIEVHYWTPELQYAVTVSDIGGDTRALP